MTKYKFYVDNDGALNCLKSDSIKNEKMEPEKAIQLFKKFDKKSFTHVDISSRNMIFKVDNVEIHFINYLEIISEYNFYLSNTLPKIEKLLNRNQKKKHSNKRLHNLKLAGIGVTVGSLAMCSLVMNYNDKKSHFVNNNIDEILLDDSDTKENNYDLGDNVKINENIVDKEQDVTHIDYESERYSKTGEYAYNLYYETILPYACEWGISPELVMAILTQESAGKNSNLMQIEFSAWEDQVLKVYNFDSNENKKYVLTNDPKKYNGKDIICISEEELNNPRINISVGCILLTEAMKSMHYHIGAGIQCYNFGVGNMRKVLEKTSSETKESIDEILSSQKNLDFTNYTNIIKAGDKDYLKHVLRYLSDYDDGIKIKYVDDSGNICENNVTILPSKTK